MLDGLALHPERLERLAAAARKLARGGPFAAGAELAALGGVPLAQLSGILAALGYRAVVDAGAETFVARPRQRRPKPSPRPRSAPSEGHPFAKLRELKLG